MSLDPAAITAIATAAGVIAGYSIKLAELRITTRSRHTEATAAEKKTILNGYNEFTHHLQARIAALETQIDQANARLAAAFDRIERLEANNHQLATKLTTLSAQLAAAYNQPPKGAPCP